MLYQQNLTVSLFSIYELIYNPAKLLAKVKENKNKLARLFDTYYTKLLRRVLLKNHSRKINPIANKINFLYFSSSMCREIELCLL